MHVLLRRSVCVLCRGDALDVVEIVVRRIVELVLILAPKDHLSGLVIPHSTCHVEQWWWSR